MLRLTLRASPCNLAVKRFTEPNFSEFLRSVTLRSHFAVAYEDLFADRITGSLRLCLALDNPKDQLYFGATADRLGFSDVTLCQHC